MAENRKNKVTDISLSRLRNVERLKELAELNPVNFYVKFILMGRDQPFSYKISEDDWKAVSDQFFQYKETLTPTFIDFMDIARGTVVHINPDFVVLHQALFDAGNVQMKPRPGAEHNRLSIYICGMEKPLEFDFMDDSDIAGLNDDLDCFDANTMSFVNFVDGDGEENSIRVDQIMVVESPDYPREIEEES
jgi:hypothetical protein